MNGVVDRDSLLMIRVIKRSATIGRSDFDSGYHVCYSIRDKVLTGAHSANACIRHVEGRLASRMNE
jgi:hypothetical protein